MNATNHVSVTSKTVMDGTGKTKINLKGTLGNMQIQLKTPGGLNIFWFGIFAPFQLWLFRVGAVAFMTFCQSVIVMQKIAGLTVIDR